MKLSLFACTVLMLAAATARADQTNSATSSTQSSPSTSWAEARGAMTTDEVVATLGAAPTKEQRDQIEQAVRERNAALREINARFSVALQKTLAANDQELARRIADEKERQRLETMRRRQPKRYSGVKKSK